MTAPITPSEQELKAAEAIAMMEVEPVKYTAGDVIPRITELIATHTRHEGKTAQEWAGEYDALGALGRIYVKKAEAAEARVKELEADIATILTDAQYEGGVQFWIRKHDELCHRLAETMQRLAELEAGK